MRSNQTKSFCIAKKTISKNKKQPMKWEKIFANDVTKQGINIQNIQTTYTTQY